MNEKSLKKNFIYNFIYQLLAIIVPLITSPYLSRTLGVRSIGIASWTNSIVFYFGMFIILGVENYGNREIAYVRNQREECSKKFWSIYTCQFINLCVVLLIYFVYIRFVLHDYKVIFIILSTVLLTKGLDIAWLFNGLEEFGVTVMRNSLVKIIILVCVFVFVHNENDLWKYITINSVGTLVGQLTLWPYIGKYVDFYRPNKEEIIRNIKPLWILFIPVLAISVFTYMDKYMIGRMSSVIQNGFYENADKIISVPKAFIATIGTVMLPRTAHLLSTNRVKESEHYIEITMVYTVMIGSALAFGMAGVSDVFSVVFWGEEFRSCGVLIQGLSPAILFSVIGSVIRSQYLIPNARDKEYTISLIVGAIVNFVINLLTISKLGAFGAVIGTLCAEIILMIIQLFYVYKELPLQKYFLSCYMFVCMGIVMYIIICLLKKYVPYSGLGLCILIIVAGSIYAVLSFLYLVCSKNKTINEIKIVILTKFRKLKK